MATGAAGGETSFTIKVPTQEPPSSPIETPAPTPQPSPSPEGWPLPEDLGQIPSGEFTVELSPRSEPGSMTVGETRVIDLRHCGLASPVDVDGSLWDPKSGHDGHGGPLTDDQVADVINEGPADFTLVEEGIARLVTEHGAVITLWRHEGSRRYSACA